MRKIILTLSIIAATLAMLLLLFVLTLRYWFNPNTLISPFSKQIQQKTGLVLRVDGKLSWHIFPRAHITVEQLSLQTDALKHNATAARIQSLSANLSLWPLISERKIIIDDISVDGLDLSLEPQSLEALKQSPALTSSTMTPVLTAASTKSTQKHIDFAIKSITLNKATLHGVLNNVRPGAILYVDHFTIKNLDSSTGKKSIPLELSATLSDKGNIVPFTLNSTVIYNTATKSIEGNPFQARINTLEIQGNIGVKTISSAPEWDGQLTLSDKNPNHTLQLLTGKTLPLKTLQGKLTFKANKQHVLFPSFNLTLNADTLNGSAKYDFKAQHLTSVLNADTVHWPEIPGSKTKKIIAPNSNEGSAVPIGKMPKSKTLTIDSQFKIQHLLYNSLSLDNVSGKLHYDGHSLSLNPFTVTALQGLYQGNLLLILDPAPKLTATGTLSHLDLALLQHYLGSKPSITGLLDAKGTLSTQGDNKQQRVTNLNGNVAVVVNKGSWTHLNMANILGFLNAASNNPNPPSSDEFSTASGTFNIQNGIANNPDLKLMSPLLTATGNGSLNLVAQTLNYHILLRPDESALHVKGLSEWLKQDIPLSIKGPLENPKIHLDKSALAETKVKDQLDNTLKKVRDFINLH